MKQNNLIPRKVIFDNPAKTGVQLSPNGDKITYLAPSEKNVLNVWIKSSDKDDDRMITADDYRGIRFYTWALNGRQILYIQDKGGDENFHLYATDASTGDTRDLTPFDGVRAQNIITSVKYPDTVLIGLNKRKKEVFDMHRIDLNSGDVVLDTENPGDVVAWMTDHDMVLRIAIASNPEDGSTVIRIRDDAESEFRTLLIFPFGENGGPIIFTDDNKNLYMETSMGSDKTRLVEWDVAAGKEIREIAENDKADIGAIITNRVTRKIEAIGINYTRNEWIFLDKEMEKDFEYLSGKERGEVQLISRKMDNTEWIVGYLADNAPFRYYHFVRSTRKLTFLLTDRPELDKYSLAEMKPVIIKSRDGVDLVCYLTIPAGAEPKNLPTVLLVHGGPWHRDHWGYHPTVQWLANRGYAVFQVNFRASTGYGKKFTNDANLQWGTGIMQHDLSDAVKWLINEGIADPGRVAIMGGSYGGYATLAGLTFTPELYACGVDIVGPSNLKTLAGTIPPYWKPMKTDLMKRIGDVENDEELNRKISPLFHAENIRVPLIIGQGANDPRVNIAESNQIVEAMRKKNLPVTYVVFPDEGHGFRRPENSLDFWGRVEEFLAAQLGGTCEPYAPVQGSTAELR
ncbi:MAG: S9 family peptidase [Spirochaetales bacterium]|nr:S9 family peptidase [Spirochaetales bacterium]